MIYDVCQEFSPSYVTYALFSDQKIAISESIDDRQVCKSICNLFLVTILDKIYRLMSELALEV